MGVVGKGFHSVATPTILVKYVEFGRNYIEFDVWEGSKIMMYIIIRSIPSIMSREDFSAEWPLGPQGLVQLSHAYFPNEK